MAKLGTGAIEAALIAHTAAHDEHQRHIEAATAEHYDTVRPSDAELAVLAELATPPDGQ